MSKNIIFSILWMAVLFFIAWPIAIFCSWFWIVLQPFEACFGFVKPINDLLEKLLTWPRELGQAVMECKESFPNPF
ncbi:hypothetical protein FisN_31Lh037 [Fistulifera solaris]|uniref:Uncharacterized protein n=1 Tax=Fistulifera solaris TaxID=1519565 RepID=A0A1Z5K695_FISSO|nr:hypothetical protein FisN_31Lh037 [Fistulifera solaris]|eukprot:GAX21749.1 hypothetical protein FisN_31Lh037 [Fistulifera solaris]